VTSTEAEIATLTARRDANQVLYNTEKTNAPALKQRILDSEIAVVEAVEALALCKREIDWMIEELAVLTTRRDAWGAAWTADASSCWEDIIANPEYRRFIDLRQNMLDWAANAYTNRTTESRRASADTTLQQQIAATNDTELVAFTILFIRKETATSIAGTGSTDAKNVGYFQTYGNIVDTTLIPALISTEINEEK